MLEYRFVSELPDLIEPSEYAGDPTGRRVRFRIRVSDSGVEIIGDAMMAANVEEIMESLEPMVIEQMLCG